MRAEEADATLEDLNSTVEVLQRRIVALELERSRLTAVTGSTFAPQETLRRRLEELAHPSLEIEPKITTRLPAIKEPVFEGQNLEEFSKDFLRCLRFTGLIGQEDQTKKDWFYQFSSPKVKKLVERVSEETTTFGDFLNSMERLFPKL